ncbi:MAG: FAD-binding oxidoreductase, partial [Chloroflexota bacterium]|nr:FAD-binding oxidoreductase [Chloroflexota bacterium]
SLDVFRDWSELVGGSCGFEACGAVRLVSPPNAERLRANVLMLQSLGVNTRVLTPAELHDLAPRCNVDDVGLAAYEPDSGCCDPVATTYGFARRAQESGARFRLGVRVTDVRVRGGRVVGVDTTDGLFEAERVILATGPWTGQLLGRLGVEVELVPVRVQVVVFHLPPGLEDHRLVYLDGVADQWLRPMPGACILAGTGAFRYELHADPDNFSEHPSPGYVERARQTVARRLPAMTQAPMRGGWAGVVAASADGKPIFDAVPGVDGLVFAAADNGSSFKTAPAIGLGLAEWVLQGGARSVDLDPFRLARFAEGAPLRGEHEYDERPLRSQVVGAGVRPI